MIEKYFEGVLPTPGEATELDRELTTLALDTRCKVEEMLDQMIFNQALTSIWQLVSRLNKYIDETTPWVLARDEKDRERLGTVLYNLAEGIRFVSILIQPFMTKTPAKIWDQFGLDETENSWGQLVEWGVSKAGNVVAKKDALFPRLDIESEIATIDESTVGKSE